MKLSFKSYLHIHTFTGQVWATMKGKKASFYKLLDCFIANSSNLSLADSISQSKFINANLNLNK